VDLRNRAVKTGRKGVSALKGPGRDSYFTQLEKKMVITGVGRLSGRVLLAGASSPGRCVSRYREWSIGDVRRKCIHESTGEESRTLIIGGPEGRLRSIS